MKKSQRKALDKQRDLTAQGLAAALQSQAQNSISDLEAAAANLKARYPELTEKIDRMLNRSITRVQRMPQMVTALYLVNTYEPPEVTIIEGEAKPVISEPKPDMEVTHEQ